MTVCSTLLDAYKGLFGKDALLDKWTFSTNGVSIMGMHGIEGFDASVRFWGRGKAVQVSGDLGEKQLQCLLEIVRALSTPSTATPVAEAIIESPAPPATEFARAA